MDQQFESEVMQDLAAEAPPSSADAAIEELDAAATEGFEAEEGMEEEALEEEMEGFEEGEEEGFLAEEDYAEDYAEDLGDVFAEEGAEEADALEEVMADALDAVDSDEFFGRLLSGISQVAGLVGRGAGAAGRVTRTVGRAAQTAGRVAGRARRVAGRVGQVAQQVGRVAGTAAQARIPLRSLIGQLLPMVQQWAQQGFDEADALDELADWFAEEEMDAALPVLAGVAARTVLRPMLGRVAGQIARPLRRQLVRSATQAAQTLLRRRGPRALRALPRIAQSVGRTAVRRRLRPSVLPQAMRRTAAQVAARPRLLRRLTQAPTGVIPRRRYGARAMPQRFILRGPVEIQIISR